MAQDLYRKFKVILLIRLLLLSVIALMSVLFSMFILENMLIKSALQSEADYFWQKYSTNNQTIAADTWNLKSYLVESNDDSALPIELQGMGTGFTRLKDQPGYTLLYKTSREGKQLLLLFNGENVRDLGIYLGVIPLTLFLVLSYLIGWLFYRKTKEVLSPIAWLASKFKSFDPVYAKLPTIDLTEMPGEPDYETVVLANSLSNYVERIDQFVNRERAFTRDVSHELRTPLTVVNMAINMIEENDQLDKHDSKALQRIKTAAKDMLELVDVFLILARESDSIPEEEAVSVHEVMSYQLDQMRPMLIEKTDVKVSIVERAPCNVKTSAKILEVMLGNLLQNAIKYTDQGEVKIEIESDFVKVSDTGIGMSESQIQQVFSPYFQAGARPSGGYGVGLTIVKRISDRFNWPLTINSQQQQGTQVTVTFFSDNN